MPNPEKTTTNVSTEGQVILPQAIRRSRHWNAGTRPLVEDMADGVLLTAAPPFESTKPEVVFGSLRYRGRAKTIEEMTAVIAVSAKRRDDRD